MSVTTGKGFYANLSYKKLSDGLKSVGCVFSGADSPMMSALTYSAHQVFKKKIQSNVGFV